MLALPPKQVNRFRVEFLYLGNNIDELSCQVVQVDPIRYSPGATIKRAATLMTVFEDDIQNRVIKALNSVWSKKLCIKLSILDPNDTAVLRWVFDDSYLNNLLHGPFDYSMSAAVLIQGEFTCGTMDMKVLR
jgi:hypothetical protein